MSLRILANYSFDPTSYNPQDVITTDVAVVGGGSAGVYTAVRLQDYNKSIVIVEKNGYLGDHAETYVDPQSGVSISASLPSPDPDYFCLLQCPVGNVQLVLFGRHVHRLLHRKDCRLHCSSDSGCCCGTPRIQRPTREVGNRASGFQPYIPRASGPLPALWFIFEKVRHLSPDTNIVHREPRLLAPP